MAPLTYLIKFKADGQRESTLPVDSTITPAKKAELIKQGYIEVPAAEWQEYCNGKIRGKDGTPVDPPPYVPSKDEKLAALDAQYDSDIAGLSKYYAEAQLEDDTDLQEEIKAELAEVKANYIEERKAIEEGDD